MKIIANYSGSKGSVLMLTMLILFLMSLMAVALMSNTVTELQVSGNTIRGRDAFSKADSMTRIGVFTGRALLHEDAGNINDLIKSRTEGTLPSGRLPYNVAIDPSVTYWNVNKLGRDRSEAGITERYLIALRPQHPT